MKINKELETIALLALGVAIILIVFFVGIRELRIEEKNKVRVLDVVELSIKPSEMLRIVYSEVSAYTLGRIEENAGDPCVSASGLNLCNDGKNTVANNCLEFGTKVKIEGEIYEVQDRMNSRYGCENFDIAMDNHSEAINFGRKTLEVSILK